MTGTAEILSGWRRAAAFVRESLRDNDTDFTVGPIRRALGLLTMPMMLEMSMEAIFAVVDIAFVSRLGMNAITSVGLTEALITVLYALAIGLGMGVTCVAVATTVGRGTGVIYLAWNLFSTIVSGYRVPASRCTRSAWS